MLDNQKGRSVLNTGYNLKGMSLIELMIAVAIVGILLVAAAPNFSDWMQNIKIRNAAEAVQNGLQLAHVEAVHRNSQVRFQLTTTTDNACALSTTNSNWVVSLDDPTAPALCATPPSDTVAPRIIRARSSNEVSETTVVAADQSTFIFNGLGRATNIAAASGIATISFSNPTRGACAQAAGPMRCLNVVVTQGGKVRMCDPALPANTPQGC